MKTRVIILAVLALAFISCSRDPNVAKVRYLENGNKYFAKGKYKEASIMYRNSLQKDQRYGPAYYHLALTDLKLGRVSQALGSLRRALELIPKDQPEYREAQIRLAEIYIGFSREAQPLAEVDGIVKELLQRDPNSFDGHRLRAELDFVQAQISFRAGHAEESQKLLDDSIAEYRKAASIQAPTAALNMQLARALAASRQYAEAERIYKEVIAKDKTQTQAYTELYTLYLAQNKMAEAEQTLKNGAASNPKQVNYLVMLANLYSATKRHDDMVNVLNQIKSHAKEFERAYLVVGDFYFRTGDLNAALKEYKIGIDADPKQKATYEKRMIEVLMRQGKRREAGDVNAAILKDNPKDSDARGLQASMLLDRGEVQKAVSELQAVVNATPDNFVARYNLGRAHVARGEIEQARQQFAEAIRLRPDYLPPRVALGQMQVLHGDYDAAIKTAQEILSMDRKNGAGGMIAAAALMGSKKYAEARVVLDAMRQANPNAAELNFSLGMVSLSEGKLKEAEEIFRKGYAENPKDTRSLIGLVEAFALEKRYDEAIKFLQGELDKDPSRGDLRLAIANLAARTGNYDMALNEYQKLLSTSDKDPRARGEVYMRMGEAYRRKGDSTNAAAILTKAREALPDNLMVLDSLAMSLADTGRKEEARQTYEQALKLNPRDAVALNNVAFLMAETGGDLDQALTYAQRAKQAMPKSAEVADTLGWIYLKKNMSDNAMDIFQGLVVKKPENSTYRYHLGMALAQKGDKPRALKELEQALRSNPQKEEEGKIRDLINKLQA
jgi:tetratricopeptide (TPR) repeat protein